MEGVTSWADASWRLAIGGSSAQAGGTIQLDLLLNRSVAVVKSACAGNCATIALLHPHGNAESSTSVEIESIELPVMGSVRLAV